MATSSFRRPYFDNTMMCPGSFPDSFKDFFHTLNEDDDSVDVLATMLEDKLIPRSDTSSESGVSRDYDPSKRTCRRGMSMRHYKRRSSDLHNNRKLPINNQNSTQSNISSASAEGVSIPAVSPAVNRRRSSSIAATRPPPDLHRFLQTEQNRPWGYLNTSSPPITTRTHLSPNHNTTVSPAATSPVFNPARIHLSPGTSPSSRDRDLSNSPSPRRGQTPDHHHYQRTRYRTASMPVVARHRVRNFTHLSHLV